MVSKSYQGPRKVYSEEFKQDVLGRIKSGEFNSAYHASVVLGLQQCTVLDWIKKQGLSKIIRPVEVPKAPDSQDMNKEKKPVKFVEDVPESFKNEAEKANYFMMRAFYLEELFKLSDLDEDVKKKALQQLNQRVNERIARGDKSPY